jgi:hypothetical protein
MTTTLATHLANWLNRVLRLPAETYVSKWQMAGRTASALAGGWTLLGVGAIIGVVQPETGEKLRSNTQKMLRYAFKQQNTVMEEFLAELDWDTASRKIVAKQTDVMCNTFWMVGLGLGYAFPVATAVVFGANMVANKISDQAFDFFETPVAPPVASPVLDGAILPVAPDGPASPGGKPCSPSLKE